jgi:Zn finger protein HypA/HybF involved in hydrogenase expression
LTKFYNFLLSVKIIPNNLKCLGCEQDFDASALDADVSNSLCNLCHAAFCGDDGFPCIHRLGINIQADFLY